MTKRILSICIPTYNRLPSLISLVTKILKVEDNRFEVVVSDDSVNDATIKALSFIKDDRLIIHHNSKKLGFVNVSFCLTLANGLYSILLLDKDSFNTIYLSELIDLIEKQNLFFGCVKLTCDKVANPIYYSNGEQSLYHMAYLSRHCSGYFYKTSIYRKSKILQKIIQDNDPFPFPFELINAELSVYYGSLEIQIPILQLEKEENSAIIKSGNFLREKIYFMPHNREVQFLRYVTNLSEIGIPNKDKFRTLKRIYYFYLFSVSTGFRVVMKTPSVCQHSDIECRNISFYEMLKHSLHAVNLYLSSTRWIGLRRYIILISCHIRNIVSMINIICK